MSRINYLNATHMFYVNLTFFIGLQCNCVRSTVTDRAVV